MPRRASWASTIRSLNREKSGMVAAPESVDLTALPRLIERVLKLPFAHSRAPGNAAGLGPAIELRLRGAAALAGSRTRSLAAPPCHSLGIVTAHGGRALAPTARADMRSAFALLLPGRTARLLALGLAEVPPILGGTLVFRSAGVTESNGDGLSPILDLAAPATATALQFAVLELVH